MESAPPKRIVKSNHQSIRMGYWLGATEGEGTDFPNNCQHFEDLLLHIFHSSFSPKAKVRIRHYVRETSKSASRTFFTLLTRIALQCFVSAGFTNNVNAHRPQTKLVDAESDD